MSTILIRRLWTARRRRGYKGDTVPDERQDERDELDLDFDS
jgi:hypothetical protein